MTAVGKTIAKRTEPIGSSCETKHPIRDSIIAMVRAVILCLCSKNESESGKQLELTNWRYHGHSNIVDPQSGGEIGGKQLREQPIVNGTLEEAFYSQHGANHIAAHRKQIHKYFHFQFPFVGSESITNMWFADECTFASIGLLSLVFLSC